VKRASPTLVLTERHGKGALTVTQRAGDTARPITIKGHLQLTVGQVEQLLAWLAANPATEGV